MGGGREVSFLGPKTLLNLERYEFRGGVGDLFQKLGNGGMNSICEKKSGATNFFRFVKVETLFGMTFCFDLFLFSFYTKYCQTG